MTEKPTLLEHVQHQLTQLLAVEPELGEIALSCLESGDWTWTYSLSAAGEPVAGMRIWPAGIGVGDACEVVRVRTCDCSGWTPQDDADLVDQLRGVPDDASSLE